jgi:hypothetical protein
VRQATLVAFYGPKHGQLREFLERCQNRVGRSVRQLGTGIEFRPYPLAQIHATVLGLERSPPPGFHNRNFQELRGRPQVMRLPELFEFILDSLDFPFHAQFGGFEDHDYPFQSRGARPYYRSFSLQDRTAVIIGWPLGAAGRERKGRPRASLRRGAQGYPMILDELRRGAQRFNVLHRWHRKTADVDNDLYLRLGVLESELAVSKRERVEVDIRQDLSASLPLIVRLTVADMAVVSYPADDETLPIARSKVVRLSDPRLRDEDFVAALYA